MSRELEIFFFERGEGGRGREKIVRVGNIMKSSFKRRWS
jgi:hypothetical protein